MERKLWDTTISCSSDKLSEPESGTVAETSTGTVDCLGTLELVGTRLETEIGTGTEMLSQKSMENQARSGRFPPGSQYPAGIRKLPDFFLELPSRFRSDMAGRQRKNPGNSGPEYCFHKITVNP